MLVLMAPVIVAKKTSLPFFLIFCVFCNSFHLGFQIFINLFLFFLKILPVNTFVHMFRGDMTTLLAIGAPLENPAIFYESRNRAISMNFNPTKNGNFFAKS